ncbi:hypothetical protein [Streptomyces coerulescens]|uniref:Uncharacterized protein n=1 Tax=Streptomyces coerulescens TaxID=29304 RepID=A0ABW0CV43_STRCD|nr:hypothetical protein POD33_26280 [Streptomyces moderatus]
MAVEAMPPRPGRRSTSPREADHGESGELHDVVADEFGFPDEWLAMSISSICLLLGNGEQADPCGPHRT